MTSFSKKGHREILEEFIILYQNEPCLWRVKSKEYHDRGKREAAYQKLTEKLKEIDPKADRDAVVKKINGFRTNHRKEKKKVENSIKSGAGTEDVYEPTLWYFRLFEFLGDQDTPRQSSSNLNENVVIGANEEGQSENLDEITEDRQSIPTEISIDEVSNDTGSNSPLSQPQTSTPKKGSTGRPLKRTVADRCNNVLDTIQDHFKRPKVKDDRHDIFGKNVTMKLRDVQDHTQRLIAENLINEALFMAELGQLTMSHCIRVSTTNYVPPNLPYIQGTFVDDFNGASENSNASVAASSASASSYYSNFTDLN